ncbi:MAG: hypothetical protein ABSG43_28310 [Solirubrobacteraceae bacterium]
MLAGSLIPLLDPLCEFLQSVCWADRAVKSSTLRTAAWRMPMVGRFGMPRRIEIPALVDAVVMGVIAVLDQVIATLRLGTVDVVRRPQLLDAERDLGIEIGVVVLEIAQPDAFQPNHAGWRFLVMELVPFVRIAGTRIEGVAGLEKEVTELLEALGDEPHAIVGQGRHSARSLGLKPAESAVDILDILYFVESLYLL